jgi:hypothetical protein
MHLQSEGIHKFLLGALDHKYLLNSLHNPPPGLTHVSQPNMPTSYSDPKGSGKPRLAAAWCNIKDQKTALAKV